MKISSDALTFNDLLEEAQTIEADFLNEKELIELGPEPEAARQFQEALRGSGGLVAHGGSGGWSVSDPSLRSPGVKDGGSQVTHAA